MHVDACGCMDIDIRWFECKLWVDLFMMLVRCRRMHAGVWEMFLEDIYNTL